MLITGVPSGWIVPVERPQLDRHRRPAEPNSDPHTPAAGSIMPPAAGEHVAVPGQGRDHCWLALPVQSQICSWVPGVVDHCRGAPAPFPRAIQARLGLPVFDIVTLTRVVHYSLTRQPFASASRPPPLP